jgi:hypothetical protein
MVLLMPISAMAAPGWQAPAPGSPVGDLDRSAYRCLSTPPLIDCRLNDPKGLRLGAVPASGQTLRYRDGRLERISTTVDTAHFEPLRKWLADQLGPGEETTERLRAGMGGAFPNVQLAWRLPDRGVLLEQHFERVTQSAVSVMAPAAFEALLERRSRERIRGLRDL